MSKKPTFAVLGAGNGGTATAADLTVRGFDVHLWEHPDFKENIKPYLENGGINLEVLPSTPLKEGFAKVKLITTDIEKAINGVDVVMIIVPSFAHKTVAELCVPYLQEGQVVVINPGNFGAAIQFSNIFKQKGKVKKVIFAEAECLIYACRKKDPQTIWIRGYKEGLRIVAFPAKENDKVISLIKQVYPEVLPGYNVFETGLSNPNPIIHTPIMLLNAGLIERPVDFLFYKEGMTPAIAKVVEAIDAERMTIGRAFKTEMRSMYEQDKEWYGYQGAVGKNIYETTVNNSIYQWSKAPNTFQHRYLTEDIPYGLAAIEDLGKKVKVNTPIVTSMINLAELVVGENLRKDCRTLNKLGMNEMSVEDIIELINEGI